MYNYFVQVILNNNSKSTDRLFTYAVPEKYENIVQTGKRVKVSFGRNKHMIDALVVSVENSCDLPEEKLKEIMDVLDDEAVVSDEMIKLSFWMRERYICKYSDSIRLMIPSMIQYKHNIRLKIMDSCPDQSELSEKENELLKIIKSGVSELDKLKKAYGGYDVYSVIDSLKQKNAVKEVSSERIGAKSAYEKYVFLAEDKELEEYNINKTENQIKVIEYLKKNDKVSFKRLSSELGVSSAVITNLIKKNILNEEFILYNQDNDRKAYKGLCLNEEQQNACDEIISSEDKVFLLHGVTGSGKTEVYMNIIEHYINENKQSIMLVPEISLTAQTIDRFEKRFGNKIAVFHSKLTKKEKFIQWYKVYNHEVDVVIGARSAIFAPIKNLGVIVIDEEHEDSYISSTSPKYDTKEVAIKMSHELGGKVILGSATPSINTYYMARKGQIKKIDLKKRVNNQMPDIKIIDMSSELDKGNNTIISEELYISIKESLKNHEQVILFLNKRGYSGFVSCKKCGYVARCDRCDVSMTYHVRGNMLKCHYCGRTKKMLFKCPKCGSEKIEQFSAGTQHVEKLIKQLFPKAVTERMDFDSMTGKDSYENIYREFKKGKIDILIGTQMLAKGFDFPEVTTVGVLSADAILNLPFYNSSEKTFQLITQVSGRAGRGSKKGKVFVQTYEPENYIINAAKDNNYDFFINQELKLRKEFAFPPFINIINICLISKNEELVNKTAFEKYEEIKESVKHMVEGRSLLLYRPVPHSIYKVNNEYRINLFMKASNNALHELRKILRRVYMEKDIENIRVSINVNTDTI
ncbi:MULTISPECIES: primosomal protein N' [unclassified Sedimentibacter]|uniref:primosomal protein N' n=1 Tax=unclassified Sedimentibacter TaxID=2649220 RepID=UPI0027DF549C|nr:primosomal protein N' [Sedimentibacter sp. MB35-C1]WMJ76049.1 primosomal protein N' [Sedimentibacter sp. MB35-C1]